MMNPKMSILLVDDEPLERGSLSAMLRQEGYIVATAENGEKALSIMEKEQFDIVLADIRMKGITGIDLLKEIKQSGMEAEVILITAYGTVKDAVEATKLGAYDYVEKNPENMDEELKIKLNKVAEKLYLVRENRNLKTALNFKNQFGQLIGQSSQMQELYDLIRAVAGSTANVLIQGETGTGKSIVAREIHDKSKRSAGPYIQVNCAGLPKDLLESEMFGHVKGSFTSAIRDKAGKFELADTGTILLDDIDTLPLDLQAKLLRVLQDQQFERVGSTKTLTVDVRIIAASNQNLEALVSQSQFRADLFYRLNVVPILLPPLRDRDDDILILANYFLNKFRLINNKNVTGFTDGALQLLEEYDWPGNVRQLENAVERAVILEQRALISTEHLMLGQQQSASLTERPSASISSSGFGNSSLKDEMERVESDMILEALKRNRWNRGRTAKELCINRVTLYKKMKKYGLND